MNPVDAIRIAAVIFVVALFPLGYLKGCSDEKEKYDEFKSRVEAEGKAQEKRTAERVAAEKLAKEKSDAQWQSRVDRLNNLSTRQSDELQQYARRSIVPPAPAPAGSGGSAAQLPADAICFSRAGLSGGIDASLQKFGGRLAASAQQGATAIAGFKECAAWALNLSPGGVR